MRKKAVTVVLILGILLTFTGTAFSDWIPMRNKFGPITIECPGHPWGDQNQSPETSWNYRSGSGGGYQGMIIIPIFTNFTVQFYLKYVAKGKKDTQSSIWYNSKSK